MGSARLPGRVRSGRCGPEEPRGAARSWDSSWDAGAEGSLSVVTAAGAVCPALFLRTVLAAAKEMAVILLELSAPVNFFFILW